MDQPRLRPAKSSWEFQEAQLKLKCKETLQLHFLHADLQHHGFWALPTWAFYLLQVLHSTLEGDNRVIPGKGVEDRCLVDYGTGVKSSAKKTEKR